MNIFQYTKQNSNIMQVARMYGIKEKDVCPFHKDEDPSFSINERKQYFKCFGCGIGGDVIDLVAKLEDISKVNACKKILSIQGLEFVNDKKTITKYMRKRLENQKLETLYHNLYKDIYKRINRLKNIRDTFNSYNAVKYISELDMILEFLDKIQRNDKENITYLNDKLERTISKWEKINLME